MKRVLPRAILGAALLALAPAALLAADHEHHHMAPAAAAPAFADATVKKIDKAAGKVTLAHGPLTNFNMPAMTMAFTADPATALDSLKEGDKVRFVAESRNGMYYATRIEAAK